jgi:hypothetical protein
LPERPKKKPTFKTVAILVRATIRMKKSAEEWRKSRKIQEALIMKVEAIKKAERAEALKTAPRAESMRASTQPKIQSTGSLSRMETKKKSRKSSSVAY